MNKIEKTSMKILRNLNTLDYYDSDFGCFISNVSKVVNHCVSMTLKTKLTKKDIDDIKDIVAGFLYD
jgi:hypothetical protein